MKAHTLHERNGFYPARETVRHDIGGTGRKRTRLRRAAGLAYVTTWRAGRGRLGYIQNIRSL